MKSEHLAVAAFDLATSTGVCWGTVGAKPQVMTLDMRAGGPGRAARLAWFFETLTDFFAANKIDIVRYEEPMAIAVANRVGASDDTITMLRGAVAILEICAVRAKIFDTQSFTVHQARRHVLGPRPPKGEGKAMVMKMARTLGVDVEDDNQSDAWALWTLACGHANPRIAHLVTPLFAGT